MDNSQLCKDSLNEPLSSDMTGEISAEATRRPRSPTASCHDNRSLTPDFARHRFTSTCFDYNRTVNQNLDMKRALTPSFDNHKYLTERCDKERSPTLSFDKQQSWILHSDKHNSPPFVGGTFRSPKWSLHPQIPTQSNNLSSSSSTDLQSSYHILRNTSTLKSTSPIDEFRPAISNHMSEAAFGSTSLPSFLQEKANARPSSTQPSICTNRSVGRSTTRDLNDMTNLSQTPDYKADNFYSHKRSACRPVDEILRKYGISCGESSTQQARNDSCGESSTQQARNDSCGDAALIKRLVQNHTRNFDENERKSQNLHAEPSELSVHRTKLKEHTVSQSTHTVNAPRDKDRLSTKSSGLTGTSTSLTVHTPASSRQSAGLNEKPSHDRHVGKPSPHSSPSSSPGVSVVDEIEGGKDEDVSSMTTEAGHELPSQEKCSQYISSLPEKTPETPKSSVLRVDIHSPTSSCQVTFSDGAHSKICIRGAPTHAPPSEALTETHYDCFPNAVQVHFSQNNRMMKNASMPTDACGDEGTSSQLALQAPEKFNLASGGSQTSLSGCNQQLPEKQAKASWNSVPINPYSLPPFMDAVDVDSYIRSQHLLRLQRVVELGQMTNFLASLSSHATRSSPDFSLDSTFKNFCCDNVLSPSTDRWSSKPLPLASPQGCAQAGRLNENQVAPIALDNTQQCNNSNADHLHSAKEKEKGNKKVANKDVVIYYSDEETKVGIRGGKKKRKRQILRRAQELRKPDNVQNKNPEDKKPEDKKPEDKNKDKAKDEPRQKAREMRTMLMITALLVVMVIMIVLLLPGLKAALS